MVRATDVAGRIGGEEFAVLMPESALDQARQLAERIRAAVQALNIVYGEVNLGVTVSIGLVELDASSTADQALSLADKALYSAKAHGRNRVEAALSADH
ncbi:Response regulator PleD [bioreactor metagenome]|uniref:Response regulator PleD n=1 Tax=bioreactor metagenome TaxID=1076179 RepID=A0A645IFR9_9ZZZZ